MCATAAWVLPVAVQRIRAEEADTELSTTPQPQLRGAHRRRRTWYERSSGASALAFTQAGRTEHAKTRTCSHAEPKPHAGKPAKAFDEKRSAFIRETRSSTFEMRGGARLAG
jgi:hypothetical protein